MCVVWATIAMVMLWSSSVVKANWARCGRAWMLCVTGSPVKAAAQTVVETVARNLKGGWTDNHNIQKVFIRKILGFLATREICTIWWFANRELHLSVDFCFRDWVILSIALWESLNIIHWLLFSIAINFTVVVQFLCLTILLDVLCVTVFLLCYFYYVKYFLSIVVNLFYVVSFVKLCNMKYNSSVIFAFFVLLLEKMHDS